MNTQNMSMEELFAACQSIPDILEVLLRVKNQNIQLGSELGPVNADRIVTDLLAPALAAFLGRDIAKAQRCVQKMPTEIQKKVSFILGGPMLDCIHGTALIRHWMKGIPGAQEIQFPEPETPPHWRMCETPADLIAMIAEKFDIRDTDSDDRLKNADVPCDTTDFINILADVRQIFKVVRDNPEAAQAVFESKDADTIKKPNERSAYIKYETLRTIGDPLRGDLHVRGFLRSTHFARQVRLMGQRLADNRATPISPSYLADFVANRFDAERSSEYSRENSFPHQTMR